MISVQVNQRQKKEGHPELGGVVKLLLGAYRECGILPGEEMECAGSTTSVISRDYIPSGKQVRECGARVKGKVLISMSVLISWYISALPQYLDRFAARYANPLPSQIPTNLNVQYSASGFEVVRSTNKMKQAPTSECLFHFVGDPTRG